MALVPGSGRTPIPDHAVPVATIDPELFRKAHATNSVLFCDAGDFWTGIAARPASAGRQFLWLTGITDRSRLEAGVLSFHPFGDKALTCVALRLPHGYIGQACFLPIGKTGNKRAWLAAAPHAHQPVGDKLPSQFGAPVTAAITAPDAMTTPEAKEWPSTWTVAHDHDVFLAPGKKRSIVTVKTDGTGLPLVIFDGELFRLAGVVERFATGNRKYVPSTVYFVAAPKTVRERADDLLAKETFIAGILHFTGASPAHPIVCAGGSYGGIAAAFAAMRFPHVVAGAVALSAAYDTVCDSLWVDTPRNTNTILVSEHGSLEWQLFESFAHGERLFSLRKDVSLVCSTYPGGHGIGAWRERLVPAYATVCDRRH